MNRFVERFGLAVVCLLVGGEAAAAIVVPGANGKDGVFAPTAADHLVDLRDAKDGAWDDAMVESGGKGVYDKDKWAVVFRYTSVDVPAGTKVRYINRAGNPPVVWLVSGDVQISGTVDVSALPLEVNAQNFGYPGPGGFSGGRSADSGLSGSGGFGIGGAWFATTVDIMTGGSYAAPSGTFTTVYGDSSITYLIGGSGGGGGIQAPNDTGGGGGGAILIAAQGTVQLSGGAILANGASGHPSGWSSGGGSGGAVRIVANRIGSGGPGSRVRSMPGVAANGGRQGSPGRIRLEAADFPAGFDCNPAASSELIPDGSSARIWPESGTSPVVRVASMNGIVAPADPRAAKGSPPPDLTVAAVGPVLIGLETMNMPTNTAVKVYLTPFSGQREVLSAEYKSGDYASAMWEAAATLKPGRYAVQVHALAQP